MDSYICLGCGKGFARCAIPQYNEHGGPWHDKCLASYESGRKAKRDAAKQESTKIKK